MPKAKLSQGELVTNCLVASPAPLIDVGVNLVDGAFDKVCFQHPAWAAAASTPCMPTCHHTHTNAHVPATRRRTVRPCCSEQRPRVWQRLWSPAARSRQPRQPGTYVTPCRWVRHVARAVWRLPAHHNSGGCFTTAAAAAASCRTSPCSSQRVCTPTTPRTATTPRSRSCGSWHHTRAALP
jgi:hypothetical protein